MKYSQKVIEQFFNTPEKISKSTTVLVKKLRKNKPKNLDTITHHLHQKAFETIDCLDCANCCKSISPGVSVKDIDRLAKFLRMKPRDVTDQYFELDNEGEYVFLQTPCPFLMDDNYCMVYEARPKACREYPHTDRRKFSQILNLSKRNCEICPAVFEVFEGLKKEYL